MSERITHFRTLILGAGFGGLGMGAQLARNGDDDFVILERSGDIGGVWLDNNYPGAACDTEAHLYCYSFFPHLRVSRMYAGREELLGYMHRLADAYGLRAHLRLNHEITEARWDGESRLWRFETRGGNATRPRTSCRRGAAEPTVDSRLPGLETYRGASFHSARWNGAVELRGKRVASVGNAASAVQYVPEIAPEVAHLTVFQRSANWIMPRNQQVFTQEQLDAYEADPAAFEASRRHLHAFRENGFRRTQMGTDEQRQGVDVAKGAPGGAGRRPAVARQADAGLRAGLQAHPALRRFLPALTRPNVTLETRPIKRFYAQGIVTADGEELPFDAVVFGTGFASQAFHGDLAVLGAAGANLSRAWEEARPPIWAWPCRISRTCSDLRTQHQSESQLDHHHAGNPAALHRRGAEGRAGAGRGAERQAAGVRPLQRALAGGHDHVGVFRQLLQLVQERGGQGHQQLVRDR